MLSNTYTKKSDENNQEDFIGLLNPNKIIVFWYCDKEKVNSDDIK